MLDPCAWWTSLRPEDAQQLLEAAKSRLASPEADQWTAPASLATGLVVARSAGATLDEVLQHVEDLWATWEDTQ